MSAKPGRNEPCPCGSGRKYKRCCSLKETPTVSEDLPWRQVRKARTEVHQKVMEYSTQIFDESALQRAWEEWCGDWLEPVDFHQGETILFMSWFLANWSNPKKRSEMNRAPVAVQYAHLHAHKLPVIEREYLESMIQAPFSFFDVTQVDRSLGFQVKDILTGHEEYIDERGASESVREGDIVFGKVGKAGDVAIFEAVSEISFPPSWKGAILVLREASRKVFRLAKTGLPTAVQVSAMQVMICKLYRELRQRAKNPVRPTLVNTDGERMSFNKILYEITDAGGVFDALAPLCVSENKKSLLEQATRDSEGKLIRVEFPWLKRGNPRHKGMGNTVYGHIVIDRNRMTIETNSDERAALIKELVQNRAGTLVKLKTSVIEPLEAKLAATRTSAKVEPEGREHDELLKHPEVQAKIKEMQAKHMGSWVKERIPALGGKTPIQAVKTPEGREMVQALLADFERSAGGSTGDREFELGLLIEIRQKLQLQ